MTGAGAMTLATVAQAPSGAGLHALAWIVLALPLAGTVLCAVCAARRVQSKLPAWISVTCLGVAFALTLALFAGESGRAGADLTTLFRWIDVQWGDGAGQSLTANLGLYIDSLTMLWMLFVTGLGALIALYASEYMAGDLGVGYSRFFFGFNLFVFMMSTLVMADNLLLLYLGWEGVGLCSYLLIGYFYQKPSAVAAAKKAFIVNRIGDLGLALGVMLTFVKFGTVQYAELWPLIEGYYQSATAGHWDEIPMSVQGIALLLMVGAFGKSAQFPLYVWLPDAMEGPTPVSALIHAATMVTAGVYLIARTYPLFQVSEHALMIVAWVGTISALLAATIGMAQFDIKRIMAYSTVSQLGYMFAGLGVLTAAGGAFHVFTHAFFKATLFLCCGAVMHGFAGQLDLRKLSGVGFMKGWGIVAIAMLVGCLNLAGAPLTAGYFSKDMILAESFVTPKAALIGWILLLTAGLTAYYTFRVFFRVFVGPQEYHPGEEFHGADPHHGAEAAEEEHFAEEAGHGGAGRHGAGGHFHPHAPGWAINTVLVILAVASILAAPTYFVGKHHGWVGGMVHDSSANPAGLYDEADDAGDGHAAAGSGVMLVADETGPAHGSFLGMDPHKAMYFVSSGVGLIGIAVAWLLHYRGRTGAARSAADNLAITQSALAGWAQHKWYVDEFYDFLLRKPLRALSHIFHAFDRLVVDGLVNLAGFLPRLLGAALRPSQSGELHGYAVGMAGGVALLLLLLAWALM
ncbi:MAG: NADH-quinone oxidoreductase subunit L [Phycisphaerales bacterium JB039]